MNDNQIKDKWLADICEGNKVEALMGALQDAREDERKECFENDELINDWIRQAVSEQTKKLEAENAELKARWEKLESKVNDNVFEPDYYSKKPRKIEKMIKVSSIKEWMQELESGKPMSIAFPSLLSQIKSEAERGIRCEGVKENNKNAFKDTMLTRVVMMCGELESGGESHIPTIGSKTKAEDAWDEGWEAGTKTAKEHEDEFNAGKEEGAAEMKARWEKSIKFIEFKRDECSDNIRFSKDITKEENERCSHALSALNQIHSFMCELESGGSGTDKNSPSNTKSYCKDITIGNGGEVEIGCGNCSETWRGATRTNR